MTRVKSMRPLISSLSLHVEGFEVHRLASHMNYSDFSNEAVIEEIYISELGDYSKQVLGARKFGDWTFRFL